MDSLVFSAPLCLCVSVVNIYFGGAVISIAQIAAGRMYIDAR